MLSTQVAIEQARENMIEQQIRPWDVLDPAVLTLLRTTPRERFVPEAYRQLAFADLEIPLPHGQRMLAPKVEGRLLQALAPQRYERALVIGTGSGYLAACLAKATTETWAVEYHPALSEAAGAHWQALGLSGIKVVVADALRDWQPEGVFEVIAVTGAVTEASQLAPFEQALAVGGRMFAIVGQAPNMVAIRIIRHGRQEFARAHLFETVVQPLIGAEPRPRFVL